MQSISTFFQRLWDFEFEKGVRLYAVLVGLVIFAGNVVYVSGEVLFGMHPDLAGFTLLDFFQNSDETGISKTYLNVWLAIAVLCVFVRITVIISSYFKSKKAIGESLLVRYILTYFVSFLVAMVTGLLLMLLLFGIAYLFGYQVSSGVNVIGFAVNSVSDFTNTYIPTLVNVKWYWIAIVLTIFLSALPGYFIHWLSHKSRFFWYVCHRVHHCPQFLHPIGTPPAFAFEFLLFIPKGLVAIAISKLIYTEPLILEMTLWFTFGYCFEIFNHSIIHYDFAYKNPVIRNLSRLFGDKGVYHLVHHSAKQEDQMINLGAASFMVWDRLFGTYRKPYEKAPPVGLTNTPEIKMNPFRIVFSGIWQLWYELRMNKNWLVRWKVVFGSIYYKPPITKEFLILEN
jgi:sterol desaturase/sphingolipid hydroxylase (fatty acid hydroxylase superfamily)